MSAINETDIVIRNRVDRFGRDRVGNYMHTSNGFKYWPFDPLPEEIHIEVIAHHLATIARWQGATRHKRFKSKIFLSVAEHSVLVARYLREELNRPDLELEGLLHDASEALIGDLIRPLKYSPEFRAPFHVVEELNERVIAERFNLVYPFPHEIKQADEAVTEAEFDQVIYRHPDEEWESGLHHDRKRCAPYEIQMLEPYPAKEIFLGYYYEAIARRPQYRELPSDFRV